MYVCVCMYVYVCVCIYIYAIINGLPLRKTTGVVENDGFHVFNIGLMCHINYFVLLFYIQCAE